MKQTLLFFLLGCLCILLFMLDLLFGSVSIPFSQLFQQQENLIYHEIIFNFRLPKSLTAVMTGAAVSVAGLVMQTLFRNPLAGPYVLGVSSGAGLGVAIYVFAGSFLPFFFTQSGWGLVLSAIIGAVSVLLLVFALSFRLRNAVSLLIVGMMFGQMAGSLVTILQNQSDPDSLKLFIVWTFGDLSAVSWAYMKVMFPIIILGLGLVFLVQKSLNTFLLGENYARALGVSVLHIRMVIIAATALLAGGVTAFTGPIAFIGIAVPHLVRGLFQTSDHRITIPGCILTGAALLLLCDIVSQLPADGYVLPINAISALIGAPVIIWIILKRK